MGKLRDIVFDCQNPAALARFWAEVIDGYAVRAYDQEEIDRLAALGFTPETDPSVVVDGPGPSLYFQRVENRKYENNRIHLDICTDNRDQEVQQLELIGAKLNRRSDNYAVMHDPEGNQFCIIQRD